MNNLDGDTDDRQILYEGDPLLMSPRNSGKAQTPNNQVSFAKDEDFDILEATAVLDNGDFGTRTITFERSEEHTSELQSRGQLVCRLLLETKKESRSGN